MGSFLQQELEMIKACYPTCTDFERNFPSLCFALATGVGKTRLMGAFIAYLYLSKGIKNYFEIDPQEISGQKEVITSISNIEQKFDEEQKKIELIAEPEHRQKAQINLELRKTILSTLPELNNAVINVNELTKSEIKQIAVERIKQKIYSTPQKNLFAAEMVKEVEAAYEAVVNDFVQNIIEIPRITIQQSNEVRSGFKDFDLDIRNLNYQPVSEEILVKKLREQENSVDVVIGKGKFVFDSPEKIIVNELINYPEIDYDDQSDLLFKLVGKAIEKFRTYLDDDNLMNVVQFHKKEIGSYIYSKMMQHFFFEAPSYEKPVVKPFTRIEEHNFSKYTKDSIHHFTETITPTNSIPNKIFSGFRKACHNLYKFDSKTEKDFAAILEQDRTVLKWLRPASNQFHIYWKHNSRQYNPDFVVETKDAIYLIKTKKEMDIESADVQEKAQAALTYCKHATDFTIPNGGKPWKYVLIPHNAVMANMSFEILAKSYKYHNAACHGTVSE